jgi:hypothetical protein
VDGFDIAMAMPIEENDEFPPNFNLGTRRPRADV